MLLSFVYYKNISFDVGTLDYDNFENSTNDHEIIENDEISINEIENNEWSRWGDEINKQVELISNESGDRDNAHYYPLLTKRLL